MASVIRLKRRLDEDPVDAIVVSFKRYRSDSSKASGLYEDVTTVLRFAGTVKSQDEPVTKFVREARKDYKTHVDLAKAQSTVNIRNKLRNASKILREKNRLKLVASHRGIDKTPCQNEALDELGEECTLPQTIQPMTEQNVPDVYHVYDAVLVDSQTHPTDNPEMLQQPPVDIVTCNGEPMVRQSIASPVASTMDETYGYDLYYLEVDMNIPTLEDQIISIEHPLVYEEMFSSYRNEEGECESEDDSNDENNWRNDYPDEDSDFEKVYDYYGNYESDEEEMLQRVGACRMDNGDSDGDDDDLITSMPDDEDIKRYGQSYAQFKLRYKLASCEDGASKPTNDITAFFK